MKTRIAFAFALLVISLGLAGCLITGTAVGESGLLFFGSLSVDNGRGVIVIPETPRHYRSFRIAASAYPVQVYRVVIVYRDGSEVSYAVGWRFTERVRYHDLHVRSERAVREIRIYQKPAAPPPGGHERRKWKGEDRRDYERGPSGPVYFRIYGLQ
jgi:hypothetical protein